MEDGTERRPEICCRDYAGRGRVRRWPDILDSNAEMIRCPMCFGTGTIPETEAASRSRDAEIRRHEGRRAAERVRNATEGQAAVSGLERWLSAEAEAKRKAEAETERGANQVPATREAEPRSVVAQRGAGASSREAARTTREAEANEQSPSPPPPPFPPRKQPPARSPRPRPRRRRRRSHAFRTVMALIVMFAILGGIGYLAIEDADEMLRVQASNVFSAVSALLESQATPVAEPAPALATSEPAPPPHLVAATLPPPPTASPTPPILSTPLPAILQPIPTDPRPPAVTAETVEVIRLSTPVPRTNTPPPTPVIVLTMAPPVPTPVTLPTLPTLPAPVRVILPTLPPLVPVSVPSGVEPPLPYAGGARLDADDMERWIIEFTNRERTGAGLSPLSHDPAISDIARAHSTNMVESGMFSHRIDGDGPTDRALDAGYDCRADLGGGRYSYGLAENIAKHPKLKPR